MSAAQLDTNEVITSYNRTEPVPPAISLMCKKSGSGLLCNTVDALIQKGCIQRSSMPVVKAWSLGNCWRSLPADPIDHRNRLLNATALYCTVYL